MLPRERAERLREARDLALRIRVGDDEEQVLRVGELALHLVSMAQELLGLHAREAEAAHADRHLRDIEAARARPRHRRRVECLEPRDLAHRAAQIPREAHGAADERAALLGHLQARDVDRRHEQLVRTRRLEQARRLPQALRVDARPAREEQRALRHRAEQLVRALRRSVRAAVDGLRRQCVRKAQMRPVRLVDEQQRAACVRHRRDGREIRRHAVVRRIDERDGTRLGMRRERAPHRLRRDAHRDAVGRVELRLEVDGLRAREHEPADERAVRVARHEHDISGRERAEQHRVDRARRAVHHEIGMIRAVELRREHLRLLDAHRRLVEVVELLHERDFLAQPLGRDERPEQRMRAEPLLVSRRMKSESAVSRIGPHGLGYRRPALAFLEVTSRLCDLPAHLRFFSPAFPAAFFCRTATSSF